MTGEEARALVRSELQKRRPDLTENEKIEMAKIIAENCDYDPDFIISEVRTMFPEPQPDAPKEDSGK